MALFRISFTKRNKIVSRINTEFYFNQTFGLKYTVSIIIPKLQRALLWGNYPIIKKI